MTSFDWEGRSRSKLAFHSSTLYSSSLANAKTDILRDSSLLHTTRSSLYYTRRSESHPFACSLCITEELGKCSVSVLIFFLQATSPLPRQRLTCKTDTTKSKLQCRSHSTTATQISSTLNHVHELTRRCHHSLVVHQTISLQSSRTVRHVTSHPIPSPRLTPSKKWTSSHPPHLPAPPSASTPKPISTPNSLKSAAPLRSSRPSKPTQNTSSRASSP
jgi:hypothetical protein